MRVVSLVIAPIMVITVVAMLIVIVVTVVVVCTMISTMSSTSCKLIFVLMIVVSLFDMVWSVVFWNLMAPAVMIVGICCIVGIHFMLV